MIDIIINPIAGNGYALRVREEIIKSLDEKEIPFREYISEYAGHAKILAKESARRGTETVLAIGGDGTCFEVAFGLMGSDSSLGIIPAGTGNDIIKTLGYPKEPIEALSHILRHPPRPLDMGSMNDITFLNECGTGFDVSVLEYALKAKKYVRGLLPYLYGVIRSIFSFRNITMKIIIDGEAVPGEKFLVCAIANGKYIGGGIPIAPKADMNDGLLDIVILKGVPNWKMPRYLPGLLSGKILDFPISLHYRAKNIQVEAPGMKLNVDGEILPIDKAEFAILPGALLVHW